MNFVSFIKSKIFLKHFLISVIITLVIIFVVFQLFRVYTHHGEEFTVPDYIGMKYTQLKDIKNTNFSIEIVDSVYDPSKEPGMVIIQEPIPGSKVKRNRMIYLTVVAVLPEQVKVPDLTDLSLRQAQATLETYGLKVGTLTYEPDIAKNAVLKQLYNGRTIPAGSMLKKGSTIGLVLGSGMGNGKIPMPFLIGLKQSEAKRILTKYSLTIGTEIFEDGRDTTHARVYRQNPAFSHEIYLNPGDIVDVWYRSDEEIDFDEYIEKYKNDSVK